MASVFVSLTLEMEAMQDAVSLLQMIHASLASKHGTHFRDLDRAIEALIENPAEGVAVHWLGEGRVMTVPCGQFTAILREARRLKVIT